MEELDQVETSTQFTYWKNQYLDIIDTTNNEIRPKIRVKDYRSIINRDGVYVSEGTAHRIIDNEYIIEGNAAYLSEITSQSVNDYNKKKFKVYRYANFGETQQSNDRSEAACPGYFESKFKKDKSGCNKDRKVIIYTGAYSQRS